MKKLLFVVHRYAPFPGGSEYNVQRLAEEALRLGHDVTVLSDEHKGDLNGVRVTSDRSIAFGQWDMIFVHGSCSTQDFIHSNTFQSPVYYLLVEPSDHPMVQLGMDKAKWIGWGTSFDLAQIKKYGHEQKAAQFIYGIEPNVMGNEGFKTKYQITTQKMYVSAGGFWPHKQHAELATAFRKANVPDCTLVLLGYDNRNGVIPQQFGNVVVLMGASQQDVYDAMYEADLYVLNSLTEGYGLVLLEAMNNGCPWVARNIAAAHDLNQQGLGAVFEGTDGLVAWLKHPPTPSLEEITRSMQVASADHSIYTSVKQLLSVL
jgi:glycosyltransferase involved in cell wall biosynthesis